ncbi:MAG TPA: hypothetical protein VHO47_00545 [Candidatus Babeliales bacterium]|nr:hypothetical protein [Candidatus Babeliales bacterium]
MNKYHYFIISLTAFFLGLITIAFQQQWIILRLPTKITPSNRPLVENMTKKKAVTIIGWQMDKWTREPKELLWLSDKSEQIKQLVYAWLEFAHNEQVGGKQISLQSIILGQNGLDAYISFDQAPLEKEWSIYRKWHHLESLIKTLKENGIALRSITWLVNHQPLIDPHLDFSQAWPFEGFLDSDVR